MNEFWLCTKPGEVLLLNSKAEAEAWLYEIIVSYDFSGSWEVTKEVTDDLHAIYFRNDLVAKIERKVVRELNDFVVKDSGERKEYDSGMVRDTQEGKPQFGLTFASDIPYEEQMLTRFAVHMVKGAEKYGPRNWENSNSEEELNRFRESALRHCLQWYFGVSDEDHAAATWFNIVAAERLKYKLRKLND